jgi:SAM-dependent methyltransferase
VSKTAATSTAFTHEDFADIYPKGIERHYWNHARNNIIGDHVRSLLDAIPSATVPSAGAASQRRILDVGCGTGIVTAFLRGRGLDCWGCDLGSAPAVDAETAKYLTHGVDAGELQEDFRRSVGMILLLDVLEHLEDPKAVLRGLGNAFSGVRTIFFTVPARRDIWSNYDERNRHFRRYDGANVGELDTPGAFRLREWSYFFHALYAPARAMKLLGIDRQTELRPPAGAIQRAAHSLVARGFVIEEKILPRRLPGSSIWGVLERG